ncbi:hypothetical protein JL722_4330 [Aureococcus anophagefferens]|nr:hypothetical protein JL722_4330 [Aureococcus anophagefferens]
MSEQVKRANRRQSLNAMLRVEGFDVVVVCTGTEHQASFWQARSSGHDTCQIEKVDHGTAVAMTESLGGISDVGTSLGSFSVTAALLEALTAEFAKELGGAAADSDPTGGCP